MQTHGKCKTNLMYILRAIVMLFLRAKVIPVNPQIHANVMRPLGLVLYCYLNMPTINKTYLILSYLICVLIFFNHCLYMYPI